MNGENSKKKYQVTFMPSGRQVEVAAGVSLIKAAHLAGVHINASCGGSGVCGKCRVILESGTLEGGKSEKLTDAGIEFESVSRSQTDNDITYIIKFAEDPGAALVTDDAGLIGNSVEELLAGLGITVTVDTDKTDNVRTYTLTRDSAFTVAADGTDLDPDGLLPIEQAHPESVRRQTADFIMSGRFQIELQIVFVNIFCGFCQRCKGPCDSFDEKITDG